MRKAAAMFVLPMLALTGCGVFGENAALGKAKPAGAVHIATEEAKPVAPDKWPDACELITKDEVTAILPGATELNQQSRPDWPRTIAEFTADPADYNSDVASGGTCLYTLRLPGEDSATSVVRVTIEAVADPVLLKRYFDKAKVFTGYDAGHNVTGTDGCYLTSVLDADLVCLKGPIMYRLGGHTTASFADSDTYSFVRDHVLPEFATNLAAKIR